MSILLSPRFWIALVLAAGLLFTHFLANRAGAARVRGQWDAAVIAGKNQTIEDERVARKEELRRVEAQGKVQQDGQAKLNAALAAGAAADAAGGRVRSDFAALIVRHREATLNPAAVAAGPPAADGLDVLADVFGRCDRRTGDLAKALDRSRAAGAVCEGEYDALRPPP